METERNGATIPDPRDRNLSSRDRMIAAGLVTLLHRGDEVIADGLHRKRLASITGQSRQTLYTHFASHTEYLNALIDVVLDPEHPMWPVRDMADYVDDVVTESTDDTIGVIHELARRDFEGLLANEHWRLVVAVWALLGERDDVREGLKRNWAFYHRRTTAALGHLLDGWGVELIEPWTTERAAHVFASLSEGLALRADALDGDGIDLLALTTATIAQAIVAPVGSSTAPLEPAIPIDAVEPPAAPTRAQIERALTHAITGYEEDELRPTFEAMSRASGCSIAALRSRFATIDDVVIAIWDRSAADLDRHHRSLVDHEDVLVRLRSQLRELATVALHSRTLTADLLRVCLVRGGAGTPVERLAEPFEALLDEARTCRRLTYDPPPRAFADHLVRTMLQSSLAGASPGAQPSTPESTAELVWSLVVTRVQVVDADLDPFRSGEATSRAGEP